MFIHTLKKNYLKILIIIFFSLIIDNLYILSLNSPPAWDQGYHLSNAFKMANILDLKNIGFLNKVNQLLDITNNYRGPTTYILTGFFLKIFKNSYYFAYLSNTIFNTISIVSIFYLGKIFKNEKTGFWAAIIFSFSSLVVFQRSDYLIDLSLTSFSILNFMILTKWFQDYKENNYLPALSGLSLGLVFLTKPTGITLFILPLLVIFIRIFKNQKNPFLFINKVILFLLAFFLIIYPWFSRHWLTIITSTINAWNWGINYQDGFSRNSIENWIFYFKKLPLIFGILNFSIVSTIFLFDAFYKKALFKIKIKFLETTNLWFFTYIVNCYLIVSFMSTKDIRFILPIYPIFCIYLSRFLNKGYYGFFTSKNKKIILIISLSISLFINNKLDLNNLNSNFLSKWPHEQIINEIKNNNLNLKSTLAILPDTKEINTFNLEAEASRKGEYVSVRQIVSNVETYKEDLKYFDWFLIKTGDQGIMTNESKNLLNNYIQENDSFITHKEWLLNDQSKLKLMRRRSINTTLSKKNCLNSYPIVEIKQVNNGININLSADGKDIRSSNLLIDFIGNDFKKFTNISLANDSFSREFRENYCYSLSQNIAINFPEKISKNYTLKARLLRNNGELKPLKIVNDNFVVNKKLSDGNYIHMENKISKVELLGIYLRKGEYKKLFDLVGIINQSDPDQNYLKNSEKIYKQRYQENKSNQDLYSILISQILQREIPSAKDTISLIIEKEPTNGNAYLANSIINVYLLDRKDARIAIDKAKSLEMSLESKEILDIIEGLNYLLEMRLINAYKIFS